MIAQAMSTPAATLHLVKLCVGIDDVEALEAWQARNAQARTAAGEPHACVHRTRMMPKRVTALCAGGSLYWVIRGLIRARQPLLAIEPGAFADGTSCAVLALGRPLRRTQPRPMRPFQGWRYLAAEAAPADLGAADADLAAMPARMLAELRELGLL